MCGICGVYNLGGSSAPRETVERMRAALSHRGPDDEGELFSGPMGLGFKRLSILDLSGGRQPMSTEDGRLAIVFNGEIYNHPRLRSELEASGERFRTRSDTETILRLYARHGPAAFARLEGMFAVALWDERKKEFVLARDPMGIKPLYYCFQPRPAAEGGERLLFASELRALLAGGLKPELDPAGVLDYLAYGKVHAPRTVFREALKLAPGHWLRVSAQGLSLHRFYRLPRRAAGEGSRPGESLEEAEERLDRVLSEAVRGAMLSDVPVGAFLSGGVDSGLVAAYMVRHSGSARVATFSVGFEGAEAGVDESRYAREVARHLGTEHHELRLPARVLDDLQPSIGLLDEPIADSAILPTFLLSRFARERVKVVLTGEGADELFAGYDRHKAAWVDERLKLLPHWARTLAAPLARRLGKGAVFERIPFESPRAWAEATASCGEEPIQGVLEPGFWEASRRSDPLEWLKGVSEVRGLNDALAFDLATVLCDSLLMKVDKSSMRASLEARVPFLNTSVVEYAMGLPASFKIRAFKGKYLLRRLAERHLPRGIAWRRKHGFIVPWEAWVRDPENAALRELLGSPDLRSWSVFDMERLGLFHRELCRGSRAVEAGLFFRIAVLGLWLLSLPRGARAP